MSIVKMKHMRLITLAQEHDQLLRKLMSLGCVELTDQDEHLADPDWAALLGRESSGLGQVKAQSAELAQALGGLKKYAPAKGGLFQIRSPITERALFDEDATRKALENAREINASLDAIAQFNTRAGQLEAEQLALRPWQSLDLPLETGATEHVEIVLGTVPATSPLDSVRGALAQAVPLSELIPVSSDKELHYVVLLCYKDDWAEAQAALKPYTFTAARFKDRTGTAAENIAAIDRERDQNAARRAQEEDAIRAHASCRQQLQVVSDRLNQDAARESARERALTDGSICFAEGWLPASKVDSVEKLLGSFHAAYEFRDPNEDEEVPTLLENPGWMKCINMVTEMFSLPAYNGIDPNPLIFGWYVFFFGFMFADVAYGLIIFAVSLFITKKYHPKHTMGYMFGLGQWLGASTAICGLFVGGFFGNALDVIYQNFVPGGLDAMPGWMSAFSAGLIVNPVNDPMTVLIIAIVIGCFHLLMGQCIHIYMGFRDGNGPDALLDVVPWWVVFAGIAALVLAGTSAVLIIGVVLLICTQGRHAGSFIGKVFGGVSSLYDITSWLSDVLSYARLMALMLATSVIAQVFNTLGALPKMVVVFLIVFIIGHVFNIGVNLIGTYVHAARLQYLEYFNKFYISGGIPFRPLQYDTKYVDITKEEK